MLKRMIIVLLVSMFVLSVVYAQEADVHMDKTYSLNPYEVGTDKVIDIPDTMKIEFKNVSTSDKKVSLVGTVTIPAKYRIVELTIDYYIMDSTREYTRAVSLTLIKGSIPNTFTFDNPYPLDLTKYEFELFVIEFYNELHDSQNI